MVGGVGGESPWLGVVGGDELIPLWGELGPWTGRGLASSCFNDLDTLKVTLLWLLDGDPSLPDGPFCFRRRG